MANRLITRFHRAGMADRAPYYIDLALQYANKEKRPIEYANFSNHLGMYLTITAQSEGLFAGDTSKYYHLVDSARWWHRQAIQLGRASDYLWAAGWGYRGLAQINHMTYRDGLYRYDSMDHYYQQCMRIGRKVNDKAVIKAVSQIYARYLLNGNRINELAPVIDSLGQNMPCDNVSDNVAYYYILHDYLAKQNQLDTLAVLNEKFILAYQKLTAAKHSEGIYEADQRFEVSQTKQMLQATVKDLNSLSTNFFLLLGVLLVLLVAAGFIYVQYHKNRRLAHRNEALLKEQNHWVKNNLQMIASLLSLQAKKVNDAEAKRFLKDNEGRVQSISLLNRLLYQQQDISLVDLGIYLSTLAEELKHSAGKEVDFALIVPENTGLKVEKSTSLGLVLNELITNSFKHGGSSLTEIGIVVEKTNASSLQMTYHDNGTGCEAGSWEASKSFGHQLVKIQLRQLYADYHIFNGDGFTFQMKIPI